jgi:hypothetical protein
MTIEGRQLHSGEFRNLFSLPDVLREFSSKRLRWAGRLARMEKGRKVYRVLVGKS